MPRLNLAGQKIGILIVLYWNNEFKKWNCRCGCGKEVLKETSALRRRIGGKKSCGCQAYGYLHQKKPDFQAQKNHIFNSYRCGARKRNIDFSLDKTIFFGLINKNCHYCNIEADKTCNYIGYESNFRYNGIDRVNNKEGYTVDNCVPCCTFCNLSKNDFDFESWKTWIKRVHDNLFNPASSNNSK